MLGSLMMSAAVLILVWRIGFSIDSKRMRLAGFVVFAIRHLPHLTSWLGVSGQMTPRELSNFLSVTSFADAVLLGGWLIFWGIRSRDPLPLRIASGAIGALVLWTPIGLLLFALVMSSAAR